MFKMPMRGTIQCPDCARIPCDVYIPRSDEADLIDGTNRWTVYECQSCHATWSLADRWGDLDPPDPRKPSPDTPGCCYRCEWAASDCTCREGPLTTKPEQAAEEPKGT